jgi:Rha family phage regulatory protein
MLNVVQIVDGKAVTTSRKVADVFEKQHKDVLRAIRDLEIPESYRERNFTLTVYEQPNPSGGKPIEHPEYLITRDGFTILAMGFTGKKAMEFKIAFINAFNTMEEELKRQTLLPRRPANIAATTAELIEKINLQLIAGMEVEPEVLRYAWNIGRLVGKTMRKPVPDEIEEFIMGLASGKYSRGEVYDMYRSSVRNPKSARCFWPLVRAIRSCDEVKDARTRYVIFW